MKISFKRIFLTVSLILILASGFWQVGLEALIIRFAEAANALLDAVVHTDTTDSPVTRGDLLYGNATPKWDDLAIGGANTVLTTDGTDPAWATVTSAMITNDTIANADMADNSIDSDDYVDDSIDNPHINWANITNLGDNGACTLAATATALATARAIGGVNFDGTAAITPTTIVVADTEDATTFVGLWTDATGNLLPKTDEQLTYVANTGVLTAVGFAGPLTGNVTGNADTCTTASAGDAAVDFFGAGVDAVTDATTCTDIEGTLLSITGGVLNATEAQDLSAVCTIGADYAGTITVNGLTMAANELITLGGQTIKHDGTDFIIDSDWHITGAGPNLSLIPTVGDTFGFHVEPGMSQSWLSNETDGIHYIFFDADHDVKIYDNNAEVQAQTNYTTLKHFTWSVDPGSWYDSDAEIFCFEVGDDFPNGTIIDEWKTSCNVDPDVEVAAELRYADAWIGLANSALIDTITTTTGTSSEDTDANINGGNAIPNGKVVYILFTADPEGTAVQWHGDIWFHAN